ncbi:MAG: SRPBCC family protein [Solirubrobacteraceae bacterium]
MRIHRLEREQVLDRPLDEVFQFFSQAHNLERITPSWLNFKVLSREPIEMHAGTVIEYRLRLYGVPFRWSSRIESWEPDHGFADRQVRGPYRLWHHRHEFAADGEGTVVRDHVEYALPFGVLGELAHAAFVRRDLRRIFDFRHRAASRLLA